MTDDGKLAGILTESDVLHLLLEGHATPDSALVEVMYRNVNTVAEHTPASILPELFERGEVAVVIDEERTLKGILTKVDLIEYMTKGPAVTP